MSLFDPAAWDGKLESLPTELLNSEHFKSKAAQPSAEERAASETEFEDRVTKALNRRSTETHLEAVRSRVPADKFEAAAAKYRQAVNVGGLTTDQATTIYFPVTDDSSKNLAPPKSDPAGRGNATPTPSGATAHEGWTEENTKVQRDALRRMTMSRAMAFRRDPQNKTYLAAEMKLYGSKGVL